MDFETARGELRRLRDEGGRESERVVDLWRACLSDLSYKLGDEVWIVYEQVYIAALDTADEEIACKCLETLKTQFHQTIRIKRLYGMYLEFKEKYDDARDLYESLLESDPTNTLIRKRLIAISKAQGRTIDTIKELNKYLELFMSDYDAWQELCDLYLSEADYKKAAFCMEELILSNPHSHLFSQKYAEIKYTEGGNDNMEIAKTYFAQACNLNPNNMRALFGLFLSASNLAQSSKVVTKAKKDHLATATWAANRIGLKYKQMSNDPSVMDVNGLEKMVDCMSITNSSGESL